MNILFALNRKVMLTIWASQFEFVSDPPGERELDPEN